MKKYKNIIILCSIIIVVLVVSFFLAENKGTPSGVVSDAGTTTTVITEPETEETKIVEPNDEVQQPKQNEPIEQKIEYSREEGMEIDEKTGTDEYKTDPVPVGKPVPVEPQQSKVTENELTCTLSVRCDTILNNISKLPKEKIELVPKDGIVFSSQEVVFFEGESVFNVLQREMKKNKIHFEFSKTPIYNSAYIEGIANLYEFDCGELSGWMYKVNDWFPNYGCSRYFIKKGDKIELIYSCDLGKDIGGFNDLSGEK